MNHNISFQLQWVSRTVMVQENNVDEAMKVLNGIMAREGMLKRWWKYGNVAKWKMILNNEHSFKSHHVQVAGYEVL